MCDCEARVHPGIECSSDGCHCHHDQPEVEYTTKARVLVALYHNYTLKMKEGVENDNLDPNDDVYVVWFSKTLQNWKCLLSTTEGNGYYYEVTHNGDKGETYIDAYKKMDNVCVTNEEMGE